MVYPILRLGMMCAAGLSFVEGYPRLGILCIVLWGYMAYKTLKGDFTW